MDKQKVFKFINFFVDKIKVKNMYKDKLELKIAGVIGDPINHTRSPLIHQYWINKNQINCFYII